MAPSKIHDQLSPVRPVWEPFSTDWHQVALASRVRLARNLAGKPFPLKASATELEQIAVALNRRLQPCQALGGGPRGRIDRLRPLERDLLIERRIITAELARGGPGRGFVSSRTHHVAALINEDDHLRLHALVPGLNLTRALSLATTALGQLGDASDFAFDPRLGFLTSDPTQVGTALRASVMLHLPALALRGQVGQIQQALGKLGGTIRGVFGDGSEACGDLYQVANASALGEDEPAIISQVDALAREVIRHEQSARLGMVRRESALLYDHIGRSYGILRCSRLLTTEEALSGVSTLVSGLRIGILPTVNIDALNRLVLEVQSGHLRSRVPGDTEPGVRDWLRAELVRDALGATSR